ncbi:MAG TPA: methionyl-tRNA formyltransferase [Dysgonamonadaceae bacterium]|nr:methionyl-tRNA formyltransferase [Dysgonamonadaceae bacterium]
MTKKDFRILFLGTPSFAVETLKLLVENQYNVVGVVTMPDKPAGRGHKLQESDVKKYAKSHNLPVLQPTNLKDEEFIEELKTLKADMNIVVAFRMLPEVVWDMPKHGTYNLHGSLLPQYRGAAPINWAIINGEAETGVTTFKLVHEIDTGQIAHQAKIEIGERDNAGTIHDKLMVVGAQLMLKTVDAIIDGSITLQAQNPNAEELKPAPKIFKDTCRIDWNSTAYEVDHFIRGLSPYPAAHTTLVRDGESFNIKIFDVQPIIEKHNYSIGTIVQPHPKQLNVAVSNGFITVLELQVEGRRRMKTVDFLNGFSLEENDLFK